MSRKFLWGIENFVENDFNYCVGLLEDMHRYNDGLLRREDPEYFIDGPYLGGGQKILKNKKSKKSKNSENQKSFIS